MNNSNVIAIIDNGINQLFIKRKLKDSIVITENGDCISDSKQVEQYQFPHGTNCAMILEKYCEDCKLVSIRILDENGKGAVKSLYPALKWCFKKCIRVINLSLGSVDFRDCEKLRCLINKYAANGMFIVAATANTGFESYPASFTNVIGVTTIGCTRGYLKDYMQMGIDTVALSEHKVVTNGEEIKTPLSNSYATPYISAMIANKLKNDSSLRIADLKKFVMEHSCIEMQEGIYEPNWVFKAYISGRGIISSAKYYFEIVNGKFEEIQEEIDTVIVFSLSDLKNINLGNSNLIYLGNGDKANIEVQGFFWSWESRQQQILNNHYQGNGIEVPIVILGVDAVQDSFYILTELKNMFANDGYNAYVIAMKPECVLYTLEYMPEPLSGIEDWKRFVESQVFYKQCDLIIWCISLEYKSEALKIFPECDVEISLCSNEDNTLVKYSFENENIEEVIPGLINKKSIEKMYTVIEAKLTEDKDGE